MVIFLGFISSFFSPKSWSPSQSHLTQEKVELAGRKPACCRPWFRLTFLWTLPDTRIGYHQPVTQGQLLGQAAGPMPSLQVCGGAYLRCSKCHPQQHSCPSGVSLGSHSPANSCCPSFLLALRAPLPQNRDPIVTSDGSRILRDGAGVAAVDIPRLCQSPGCV